MKRIPVQLQEKMTIEVNLAKYALVSSNAEITFTIEGTDHRALIDQLLAVIEYWSTKETSKLQNL